VLAVHGVTVRMDERPRQPVGLEQERLRVEERARLPRGLAVLSMVLLVEGLCASPRSSFLGVDACARCPWFSGWHESLAAELLYQQAVRTIECCHRIL